MSGINYKGDVGDTGEAGVPARIHRKSGEPHSELTPSLFWRSRGLTFKKKRYRAAFRLLRKREKEARLNECEETGDD